jgi:hypothetical protein
MASLNYSVKENIKNGDQLGMFLQLGILNGTISSLAYAMVLPLKLPCHLEKA